MTELSLTKVLVVLSVALFALLAPIRMNGFVSGGALIALGAVATAVVAQREREEYSQAVIHDDDIKITSSGKKRALVVGAGEVGRALAASLEEGGKYKVIGFADDELDPLNSTIGNILGRRSDTVDIVCRHSIDEVFLAYAPTWQQQLVEDIVATDRDVRVHVVPSLYEALMPTARAANVGDIALVRLAIGRNYAADTTKRLFDLTASTLVLVLLSPMICAVAALIKLTSRGPVIFAQERIGRSGARFLVYKFRTMVVDAEAETGPVLSKGKRDSRLTGIGRWLRLFRIDELPQLWNVIRGEMSLVGPRPERPVFVNQFYQTIPAYAQRHNVRPGITGLAQVCGGYHTDARDKLRFDLIYISHQSLWLDLVILLRTVLVVFLPKSP